MLAMNGRSIAHHAPDGPLSRFLSYFGPTLLKKYQPKGILVFSAHWETSSERLGLYFCRLFEVLVNIAIFSDGVR
jgi:aromatic ring-opening dioxygenase catalytic subunit (LigB family)